MRHETILAFALGEYCEAGAAYRDDGPCYRGGEYCIAFDRHACVNPSRRRWSVLPERKAFDYEKDADARWALPCTKWWSRR